MFTSNQLLLKVGLPYSMKDKDMRENLKAIANKLPSTPPNDVYDKWTPEKQQANMVFKYEDVIKELFEAISKPLLTNTAVKEPPIPTESSILDKLSAKMYT